MQDPEYAEQFGQWFGPVSSFASIYASFGSLADRAREPRRSFHRSRAHTNGSVAHRLGNYDESQNKPPQSISHFFTLWAAIKNATFGDRPLIYLAYILIVIALAWILAPPGWRMRILLAMVTLSLAAEFAICMLDGADGGRHLTLFNALLDFLFCCNVVFALKPAATSNKAR